MITNLKVVALSLAAVLSLPTYIYAGLLSKDELKRESNRISENFKAQKRVCETRSGNAKDICMAEAKGNQNVASAELDARDKGTAKSRQDLLVARAKATYDIANQRCDDLAGNAKSVCRKDADAAQIKATADAKLERKVNDANISAAETISDAQNKASNTKREADFQAARERCDSLAGSSKDACVNEAKARFRIM